jgi:hypothetical protein
MTLVMVCSACGGPPPKMTAAKQDDGVAANSASEERLNPDAKAKTTATPAAADPSQPYTTPVVAGGNESGASPGKKPKETPSKTGKVSKAECKALFDKYIDLTISTDSRFEGIPPEMIAGLKEQAQSQAQSQKGDPCSKEEVTRTQYNCAIVAPSTGAWQRCMK